MHLRTSSFDAIVDYPSVPEFLTRLTFSYRIPGMLFEIGCELGFEAEAHSMKIRVVTRTNQYTISELSVRKFSL